jgi:hypothetical protein
MEARVVTPRNTVAIQGITNNVDVTLFWTIAKRAEFESGQIFYQDIERRNSRPKIS